MLVGCKLSESQTMTLFVVAAANGEGGSASKSCVQSKMKTKSPVLMNCNHREPGLSNRA